MSGKTGSGPGGASTKQARTHAGGGARCLGCFGQSFSGLEFKENLCSVWVPEIETRASRMPGGCSAAEPGLHRDFFFFLVIVGSELKIYSWQDQDAGSDAWKVNALSTWLSL